MKPSWCASLPLVDIPEGDTPKLVTIVLPYYDNPEFLRVQLARWRQFPASLRASLSVIICDDASPDHLAISRALSGQLFNVPEIRVFQNTGPDIPWNWIGARNRGAFEAADGSWLLMTDMDHVLPQNTAESLVYGKHDPGTVYAFSRIEHSGERIAPHSASFFMTKAMFWKIGGYDERFAGLYGSDGQYRKRLKATAPLVVLRDRLVRYEYQGDSSTTAYQRKKPEDSAAVKAIADEFERLKLAPITLSFPYVEIAL